MPEQPKPQDAITPVEFTPLDSATVTKHKRLKPLSLVIAAALLISLLVLTFLLTAKTLIVQTTPTDASINVSGFSFRLSGNYLLWPGEHQVEVSAPGYIAARQTIMVSNDPSQKLQLALEKMPGHLQINTTPAGAAISVNGSAQGNSPFIVKDLPHGRYQISIEKPRYQPFQVEIDITGLDITQQLDAQLQPAWGDLLIDSEPRGATVSIGGVEQGVTPLTAELLSIGELVSIKLSGHKQWQQQLRVTAGEQFDAGVITLQPADGLLSVSSSPANASVTANGTFLGITPAELELAPGKTHKLRFFLDGYKTVSKTVTLQSGVEQSLNVALKPQQGQLRILVQPEDAEIWINGRLAGRSGQSFNLPAKAHRLEIKRKGFTTEKRSLTPRVGIEQVLQIKLLTEQQTRWASTAKQIKTSTGQSLKLFRPQQRFTMGASRREAGRRSNEVLRDVRLDRAFYLAATAVTNQQYKQFNRQHSSGHTATKTLDTPRQPVTRVSWKQAALYCNWLSEKENLTPFYVESDGTMIGINPQANGYRLPTEAEWAWAARYNKGAMNKFPWGDNFPPTQPSGNYADKSAAKIVGKILTPYNDGFAVSAPVASFAANNKGLFDLGSNVMEWVNDFYGIEPSLSTKTAVDPLGPDKGEFRVIRGASWRDADITSLRLSYRDYGFEGKDSVGFRVARYAQ